MDPSNSAQDVFRCDLCEVAIVQMYCDFCYVNLCISCIGKHISDDYDKHKVVAFEQRKSTLIYPKCTTHQTKICEFHCKNCNISLCSLCTTVSGTHSSHTISTLLEIYKSKKEDIEKDTEELENVISPTYEEIALDIETQLANLDGKYEKIIKVVLNQGEKWHSEINIIIDKMKAEIEDMKIKHTNILKEHLDEIKKLQSLIDETELNLSRIEESNEVTKALEYSSKNKILSKLPSKVQVLMPAFSQKTIDIEQLYKMIGSLSPLSTTKEENGYKLKKKLLEEPELIFMINTGYEKLRNVTCQSSEEIWTSGRDTSDIKCFNRQGSIVKTIKIMTGKWPSEIAVTKDGILLLCDATVYKVMDGKTEELIKRQGWDLTQICVTFSNDLLVAMYSDSEKQFKIIRFSGSTEMQTIQADDERKLLYSRSNKIKYMAENKNLNICVADWEAGAVVVVNETGNLRFRYTGHPSTKINKTFKPFGIAIDSQGQILTAVSDNHCIHILDQDGQFLSYIDNSDLKNPYGVCVDKNDDLFVAEYYTGNVKKIKYLD